MRTVSAAVNNMERLGGEQIAHTVAGRLEQATRWLQHPDRDDSGVGHRAIALIVDEGKKVLIWVTLILSFSPFFEL